ncbi:MAG: hypothetical protein SFW35_03095 [Chitinophagales bacterium]|nr:hypothetical protein [Chitinophagales bacterium]
MACFAYFAGSHKSITLHSVKRVAIIFLCVFYLFITTGMTLTVHFCGGAFKSFTVLAEDKNSCCGKKVMPVGCCKHETVKLQLEDDHNLASAIALPTETAHIEVFFVPESANALYSLYSILLIASDHSPPEPSSRSLHLLNSVFII